MKKHFLPFFNEFRITSISFPQHIAQHRTKCTPLLIQTHIETTNWSHQMNENTTENNRARKRLRREEEKEKEFRIVNTENEISYLSARLIFALYGKDPY